MPADPVPNEAIPGLAAQIDNPAMLEILTRLHRDGFILNSPDLEPETLAIVQRLATLGLADPGYTGPTTGKPYLWTHNGNGSRVLKYALQSKLTINPRARPGLAALSENDQFTVLQAAVALRNSDPKTWPKEKARHLGEDQPVYLLWVTPDLRAFIVLHDAGEIELLDLVRKETLEQFRERQ